MDQCNPHRGCLATPSISETGKGCGQTGLKFIFVAAKFAPLALPPLAMIGVAG